MLLFVVILLGSYGSCIAGHSAWLSSYLDRENPKRERILREFLSDPSNYRKRIGSKMSSYRIVRNYPDLFATYTIFVCSGQVDDKPIEFTAQVWGSKVYILKSN